MRPLMFALVLFLSSIVSAQTLNLSAKQVGRELQVTAKSTEAYSVDHLLIFIDSDSNASTGYAPSAAPTLGFDHLVQGANYFAFDSDDRGVWKWKQIGEVQRQVDSRQVHVTLDVDQFQNEKVGFAAWVMSKDWSEPLMMAPASGTLPLKVNPYIWPEEKAGDSKDATMDLTSVQTGEADGKLTIHLQTAKPGNFETTLILLDTDMDNKTGYASPARPAGGFELLIQNDGLFEHQAEDRAQWGWKRIAGVERAITDKGLVLTLDAAGLRTKQLRLLVLQMSGDWQSVIDSAPDHGLYRIKIKTPPLPAASQPALGPVKPNHHLPARDRVAQADTFSCYYGYKAVAPLSHMDLVILEDRHRKPAIDVKPLQERGVVAVAYISVGEDTEVRSDRDWYFDRDKDGKPDQNNIWKSWFADASNANWRADRLEEARRLIVDRGYDGIFLDTVDTAALYPDSLEGMVQLIHEFRQAFPDAVIVVNQGLSFLPRFASYVDAVMIESFSLSYNFGTSKYFVRDEGSLDYSRRRVSRELLPTLKEHPLKVLVLDYCGPNDREEMQMGLNRAATFGFLWAGAPIALDMVYDTYDMKPVPNKKWFTRLATPESMRYTLETDANGFPAGTTLMPSSCFGAYTVKPLVDGIEDRAKLYWSDAAWATDEFEEAHWLQISFPEPVMASALKITFALDNGQWWPSRNFIIQTRTSAAADWQDLKTYSDNEQSTIQCALPDESIHSIRLYQPKAGGHAKREHLLWVGQLQLIR